MADLEIEIHVRIEKNKSLVAFLKKNAKLLSEKHQVDEYFTPQHRNFLAVRPVKEWLRLRNSNGKFSITYKNWHHDKDGKSHYCDEYETKIKNLRPLRKILGVLNFKPLVVVDKQRKTWRYKDYEISFDRIKGLGDFVEIEYRSEVKRKPSEITKQMIEFLKKHHCGKIERNYLGYPFQILFPNETKHEKQ